MLEQYTGAAIMFLFSMGIACGMVAMTSLLGPKRKFADKMEPFECGESQLVSPHQRFSVKFYLVAVLFVLFDIEAIFFFPWAILFRRLGLFGFVENAFIYPDTWGRFTLRLETRRFGLGIIS